MGTDFRMAVSRLDDPLKPVRKWVDQLQEHWRTVFTAASMRAMPVLETVADTPPISYCALGSLVTDSVVDLANGVETPRARALDALLHAQGAGINCVFNSKNKRRWRIATCDIYAFPGFVISEHRLAKGGQDDKPREGRLLAVWVFGFFLMYLPCGNKRSGGSQYVRYRDEKPWSLGGPYAWGERILVDPGR
jgi:hypothetical protein